MAEREVLIVERGVHYDAENLQALLWAAGYFPRL
jgi:hypothetical protein